jgi:hypothetical protein
MKMKWKVTLNRKTNKQLKKLPEKVVLLTQLLIRDLGMFGACPGRQWFNFSKLTKNKYHCHLIKGKPTYVACWELIDKTQRNIEVYYVCAKQAHKFQLVKIQSMQRLATDIEQNAALWKVTTLMKPAGWTLQAVT